MLCGIHSSQYCTAPPRSFPHVFHLRFPWDASMIPHRSGKSASFWLLTLYFPSTNPKSDHENLKYVLFYPRGNFRSRKFYSFSTFRIVFFILFRIINDLFHHVHLLYKYIFTITEKLVNLVYILTTF